MQQNTFKEIKEEVQTRVQLKNAKLELLVPITFSIELANQIEIPVDDKFSIVADVKKVQTVEEYDYELETGKKKKVTLELRAIKSGSEIYNIGKLYNEQETFVIIHE